MHDFSNFGLRSCCALFVLATMTAYAQAPATVFGRCLSQATTSADKALCQTQRAAAAAGLRQALVHAGIALEPDARMIDQYQESGTWDLMRALRLSHGKRIVPAAPR